MAALMDRPPRIGDLLGLPAWLPDLPYRVLGVRDPGIEGYRWLDGYLIDGGTVHERSYLVPVARLRGLPDPLWGNATGEQPPSAPAATRADRW
ncbi:hypothetical protein Athai_50260 [Actinocatenispora thailandica]|uniref:Uncharacterized protein n=1 Tax=Actinocatenispora thailandica TaxID=227318 RepID=A0A7R7HZZ0_9ACTN|nr:hypothetical protein [Actinocatenispora thailandica]BCJ37523.1 hypothetical protein Athai_50260 [Actinocatenispora thailandica]